MDLYDLDAHVKKINEVYARRRDLMLKTMEEEFPEGVEFTHPEGGLFIWVDSTEGLDAGEYDEKMLGK